MESEEMSQTEVNLTIRPSRSYEQHPTLFKRTSALVILPTKVPDPYKNLEESKGHPDRDLPTNEKEYHTTRPMSESLEKLCALNSSAKELFMMPGRAMDRAEHLVCRAWEAGKIVIEHSHLPNWMRDNEFVVSGHRPPLKSFSSCFRSVFRLHTETANIWTHFIGFLAFTVLAASIVIYEDVHCWVEKFMLSIFVVSAILCFGFSSLYHMCNCHSEGVSRILSKLDYCGIIILIIGSFIPWLYYSFYCHWTQMMTYLFLVSVLGSACIYVCMFDDFGKPEFRHRRSGLFASLGLIMLVPVGHYILLNGLHRAIHHASLGLLLLMAAIYLTGAAIYTARVPESIWPGRFDIWFSSHQIFHVLSILAALVHYYSISEIRNNHLAEGACSDSTYDSSIP